eukprot:TRINITY_DN5747_c0_g2_i1.p1 TRINITY_DN5747_c0_g2~~TRINITY_DN5747_c0_g2_i1.p1  ORF type:complete len:380 (+),score=41.19 TRINITY_DN5747_c0_g2_i1:98-1237(+)
MEETTETEELPYGGDIQAAMKAGDRDAIRKIMAKRDAGKKPTANKLSGYKRSTPPTAPARPEPEPAEAKPKPPAYGLLADGSTPQKLMKVSVHSKSSIGSEVVAIGEIAYLDTSDAEIRVEVLKDYANELSERGFKFAVGYSNQVWVLGEQLKQMDEAEFQGKADEGRRRSHEEGLLFQSQEFLRQLETGTSEFEPTWPAGSWSEAAAENCFGIKAGMKFKYLGVSQPGSTLTHGNILEVQSVSFYVWPNTDGPIAVILKFPSASTHIPRPTGKLAPNFGPGVPQFMKTWQYVPPTQRLVTVQASSPQDGLAKVVGLSPSGDPLVEHAVEVKATLESFQLEFLAKIEPQADTEIVLLLPDGRLLKELSQDSTIGDVFAF